MYIKKKKTRLVNKEQNSRFHSFIFCCCKVCKLESGKEMDSRSGVAAQNQTPEFYQNVVVMRHGDRIDNFEPLWISTATRPWDPPLVEQGRVRAFCTGRKFRNHLGFQLHRVFVSPFLRCVQTAAEVVSALSALRDDPAVLTAGSLPIDPSKLKVSKSPFLFLLVPYRVIFNY